MNHDELNVIFNDSVVFTGTFDKCKDYITSKFSASEFDMGLIDIIEQSGRAASYVLEWK